MKNLFVTALFLFFFTTLPMQAAFGASLAPIHLDAHMSTRYSDDLPGLLKKRYIRVLTTMNQMNFFISNGQLAGYEYELLKGYEKFLNKQIADSDLNLVLEFIPVSRQDLLPKLVKGYGDIAAAGLTITPEREKKVAFTQPYLTGIDEIVVTRKGEYNFQDVSDLSGETVFVRKSSSYYQSLVDLNARLQKQGKRPVRILQAPETFETETILELVDVGGVNITVADSHIAETWSQVLEHIELHKDIVLHKDSRIAWMVRKDNPELLSSLNKFLQTHKKGTLNGNIYFNRYYNDDRKLKDPGDIENWTKLKRYKSVIKKYAKQYDFDWVLILAMAFQESGLNHDCKSPAGAVGLLQVLPSTAEDDRINIDHVGQLKNNIQAGIKYLALLRDHYFSEPGIPPRDRVRLALAAYNAGPAKIKRARDLAEKMGLDPNHWFRNVELAVLRLTGQETVRYVSNINTYYFLYKSLLD
ncbi:MAG: transporter substrate-binding domain-containing protein [Desulfohalobiaceae bacterium]|nr:transporter substrate-binding domain-containing protein [Desulfohalobiaceae bacterium]